MLNVKDNDFLKSIGDLVDTTDLQREHVLLIVDDEINNLQLLKRIFKDKYRIFVASDGLEALDLLKDNLDNISLIIADYKMPIMNGADFLKEANIIAPDTIKILLTGYSDINVIADVVNQCNLFQYVSKPFTPDELSEAVQRGLNKFDLVSSKSLILKDLKELFYKTIKSISSALDAKDPYTHGHSSRVTLYSIILAEQLKIPQDKLEEIEMAGLLHDIGKIGIPESILCKPGKLTFEEFTIMKSHPVNSEKLIKSIKKLSNIATIIKHHHEKWDGTGYPDRLKGEEIPYVARIIAVADTYDAMTSTRSYRKALSHDIAIEEIKECSGTQFDPQMVNALLEAENIVKAAKDNPDEFYSKYSSLYRQII